MRRSHPDPTLGCLIIYRTTNSADRRGVTTVQLSSGTIFLCSALSKMTASIATYPHEVIRTRLQIQRNPHSGVLADTRTYRGFVQTTVRIFRREGWRGLYKGLSINLVRTIPNNAVTLVTWVLWLLESEKDTITKPQIWVIDASAIHSVITVIANCIISSFYNLQGRYIGRPTSQCRREWQILGD
jgi:hypothetical protein